MAINYDVIANNDSYVPVGLGDPDPLVEFPPIYGNQNFSFTVRLDIDPEPNQIVYTGMSVDDKPTFVNATIISNNEVTLTKTTESILFDEDYTFLKWSDDYSSNTEFTYTLDEYENLSNTDNLNLISWNTPAIETVFDSFTFTVNYEYDDGGIPTASSSVITLNQEYQWDGTQGLSTIDSIIEDTSDTPDETTINSYLDDADFTIDFDLNANTVDQDVIQDNRDLVEGQSQ